MSGRRSNGLRAGVVLGVVLVFLVLIGFELIASELAFDLLHRLSFGLVRGEVETGSGSGTGLVLFFGLLGLWGGALGARPAEPDRWPGALRAGLAAGLLGGAILGALVFVLGTIDAAGVDMRFYMPQLSPQAVRLLLWGREPLAGALAGVALFAATGLAGGALRRGVGRGAWRAGAAARLRVWWAAANDHRPVRRVREHAYRPMATRLVLLGVLLILPRYLGQYWNFTMGTVGIYVLMGLGLNIVVGLAGLLDLGYVAFFAVGAYTVGLLTAPEPHALYWNFWLVLPVGVLVASLAGILLGIPVLRMRGDYLAIVTLGFGEIIRILVKSDLLKDFAGGPQGIRAIGGPTTLMGNPFNDQQFMYLIILGILLVIFVTNRLQHSRVGRAWIAMREDETVAQAMGVNVYRAKLLAFAIGAAFAGLGGVLFASRNQYTGPEDHALMVSINVLCLVIVGGMGSVPGVVVGAFALKGLPEILRQIDDYRILAFGGLLVAMMIWRPEGLWPSKRRRLEIQGADRLAGPEPGPGEGEP